jgi:ATP-dependent DNA helicase DinG
VEAALAERKHLIVEAGTGTGKTLAYLIPALLSGKRIMVSTGTKNLQEQLFFKDIPFLQKHFPKPLRVCYMKGRSNFACRQKIYDIEKQPVLNSLEEVADFQVIQEWEKTTQFGDRAEIRTLPESSTAWARVDARREMCTGQKCKQFERCFITFMHQRAHESDIIIVNHHLFFADLSLKDPSYEGGILPQYDAVVFDEAHEIEDVAGQYFGLSVSNYRFQELRRDAAAMARAGQFGSTELDRILERLEELAAQFFTLVGEGEGRFAFRSRDTFLERHGEEYNHLLAGLEIMASHLKLLKEPPDEVDVLLRRTTEISETLRFVMESADPAYVYWI